MVETTVQAAGFVGAGFALQDRGNGGLCSGVTFAAGGHLMMVHLGMESRAEGAEGSLERADPGIRAMTKPPTSSALGKADAFFSRSNGY